MRPNRGKNMECKYCGKTLQRGVIRSKASLINISAISDIVWTDEQDIGKLKRNEVKLKNMSKAYYCETCKLVFAELELKPPIF